MPAKPLCFANNFSQLVILPSWQKGDVSSRQPRVHFPQLTLNLQIFVFICGRRVRTEDLPYRSLSGRLGGGNQRKDSQPELRTIVRAGFRVFFFSVVAVLRFRPRQTKKVKQGKRECAFQPLRSRGSAERVLFCVFVCFLERGWVVPAELGQRPKQKKKNQKMRI